MAIMDKTFWEGKNEKIVEFIGELIPRMGRVENKKLKAIEAWRCFQNSYYRYYNDGDHPTEIRRYFEKHGVDYPTIHEPDSYVEYKLEQLANIMFTNALVERTLVELEKK